MKPLPYRSSSVTKGPWRLGHVCRLWRQITSAPSSLWSWSKLPPLSHIYTPGGYPEGSYDMLATVFERSLPLSFEYDMDPLMNDIASGVFVDIVKRHSLRWRDIVISGTPKSYMSLGEVGELPLLETASLDVWDFKGLATWTLAQILDIFRHAPKLRSLELHGVHPGRGSISQWGAFPWHQLTHLKTHLSSTSFLHDCQILAHCPNLHSFTTYSREESGPSDSMLHSKLKYLDIQHVGLLRYLRCTSLTELRFTTLWIGNADVVVEGCISALRSFLAQSSLASVDIEVVNCTAISRLVSTFMSSSIQTFKLEVTEATGDLVDLAASATPLLLSQMIHFECTITYCLDLVQFLRSLTLMIQSRWHIDRREVARLQSVRLSIGHSYNAEEELCRMIGCLRMLRAEGLTVVVFRGEL
ncbi:hypothetical protein BDZ89DRAFT_1142966 [Hymenopellis radicata]|nr:hypothetical protein BDZ89DRAFT_1142966 [Hymenopellis radicata]